MKAVLQKHFCWISLSFSDKYIKFSRNDTSWFQLKFEYHSRLYFFPGVCLEQYLLLNRRNQSCDEEHNKHNELSNNIHVFICTTMYHEADYEMEQLLRSIHDVDINRTKSGRHFESHVFFDGCIRANVLNSYVLQLVSLVEKTLVVSLTDCIKMKTPYGMQLRWKLQGGMDFTIHLKDNAKVT